MVGDHATLPVHTLVSPNVTLSEAGLVPVAAWKRVRDRSAVELEGAWAFEERQLPTVVASVDKPVNVLAPMLYPAGVGELAAAGVRRVSVGGAGRG